VGFHRNIIVQADLDNLNSQKDTSKTLTENPPSGFVPALSPDGSEQAGKVSGGAAAGDDGAKPGVSGGVAVPSKDDYLTKLVKYVPVEVLGAY
jgi:hypothetical protein